MIKKTNDIRNAIASPTKIRYAFDRLLCLQTTGIVTNSVKSIANNNISPTLSNKQISVFVCFDMLPLDLSIVQQLRPKVQILECVDKYLFV